MAHRKSICHRQTVLPMSVGGFNINGGSAHSLRRECAGLLCVIQQCHST